MDEWTVIPSRIAALLVKDNLPTNYVLHPRDDMHTSAANSRTNGTLKQITFGEFDAYVSKGTLASLLPTKLARIERKNEVQY